MVWSRACLRVCELIPALSTKAGCQRPGVTALCSDRGLVFFSLLRTLAQRKQTPLITKRCLCHRPGSNSLRSRTCSAAPAHHQGEKIVLQLPCISLSGMLASGHPCARERGVALVALPLRTLRCVMMCRELSPKSVGAGDDMNLEWHEQVGGKTRVAPARVDWSEIVNPCICNCRPCARAASSSAFLMRAAGP